MLIMATPTRWRPAFRLAAASLLFLASVAPAETGREEPAAEVVLLIDRSSSAQKPYLGPQRSELARALVAALQSEAREPGIVHLAILDFGGSTRLRRPMSPLSDDIAIPLREDPIGLTDFRVALEDARPFFGSERVPRRLVVVLTDGIPQLRDDSELDELEIPGYFGTVQSALADLEEAGAEVFFLVAGGVPEYSSEWQRIVPRDHYLPADGLDEQQQAIDQIVLSALGPWPADPLAPGTPASSPAKVGAPTSVMRGLRFPRLKPLLSEMERPLLVVLGSLITFLLMKIELRKARSRSESTEEENRKLKTENTQLENYKHAARGKSFIDAARGTLRNGLQAWDDGRKTEAKALIQSYYELALEFQDQAATVTTNEIKSSHNKINEKLDPNTQLALIHGAAINKLSRSNASTLTQVIRLRWLADPSLILREFYELQLWPKGMILVEELAEHEATPSEEASGHPRGNDDFVTQLAKQTIKLQSLTQEVA